MTVDDVIEWISIKNVELCESMEKCTVDDKAWYKLKGSYETLRDLKLYILMVTNPHNREDIKKAKKRHR